MPNHQLMLIQGKPSALNDTVVKFACSLPIHAWLPGPGPGARGIYVDRWKRHPGSTVYIHSSGQVHNGKSNNTKSL